MSSFRSCEQCLTRLAKAGQSRLLTGGQIGLEKESLRVIPDGSIAQSAHPAALGSALTHPYITTDYSEALLEFITPPLTDLGEGLQFLKDLHGFTARRLGEEFLWATSMPCVLSGEDNIPIARYGSSNAGLMKHVYRRGLGLRYGRIMQVIAGVHFNYSLPETFWPVFQECERDTRSLPQFIADRYFCLIRNLQRFGWLIPYLFGASPAVCKSFFGGQPTEMSEFDEATYFEPHATSLRLSDIGYQNKKEQMTGLQVSYNSLEDYLASLTWAIETPHPAYETIGVVVEGEYRQLNANILQIENEYYSSMRPKQVVGPEEKPVLAMRERGVRYVELRSLDVSAFDPLGVNEDQLLFLEAFLIFCLFQESPPISADERHEIDYNQMVVARRGRDPRLRLRRQERFVPLRTWASELCEALHAFCEILDDGRAAAPYTRALNVQRELVRDPELTPSARMLAEMRAGSESFFEFAMRISRQHQLQFQEIEVSEDMIKLLTRLASESIRKQRELETNGDIPFDEFLRRYFAQK